MSVGHSPRIHLYPGFVYFDPSPSRDHSRTFPPLFGSVDCSWPTGSKVTCVALSTLCPSRSQVPPHPTLPSARRAGVRVRARPSSLTPHTRRQSECLSVCARQCPPRLSADPVLWEQTGWKELSGSHLLSGERSLPSLAQSLSLEARQGQLDLWVTLSGSLVMAVSADLSLAASGRQCDYSGRRSSRETRRCRVLHPGIQGQGDPCQRRLRVGWWPVWPVCHRTAHTL